MTKDRQCLFGNIESDEMVLNDVGNMVAQTWDWLQDQYPHVELDAFVVMPNHIHGIILLHDPNDDPRTERAQEPNQADTSRGYASRRDAACRDASRSVRTDPIRAHTSTATNHQGTAHAKAPRKPLGRLIGAFKTVSTKRINQLLGTPGKAMWQGRFHDHIIRNEESLNAVRQYIAENPAKWDEDRENPKLRRGNDAV